MYFRWHEKRCARMRAAKEKRSPFGEQRRREKFTGYLRSEEGGVEVRRRNFPYRKWPLKTGRQGHLCEKVLKKSYLSFELTNNVVIF